MIFFHPDNLVTIVLNTLEAGESGWVESTLSLHDEILGSIGIEPKKGTLANSASDCPPPVENILVHS